jgi:hypothetical protein
MSFDGTIDLDLNKFRRDLRTLKNLAPEYRKEVAPRLKAAALPMLQATKAAVPTKPPTRGWPTGKDTRFAWNATKIRQQMVLQFRAAGFRKRQEDTILRMYSRNAAFQVFDLAARSHRYFPNTQPWINSMTLKFGRPSRIMWATAERYIPNINRQLLGLMLEIERRAQAEIRRNR